VQEFFNDVYDQSQQYTCNDHGGDWKIKTEIFFFNPDITRQSAYPVKLIMKEINNNSHQQDNNTCQNDPFPSIAAHDAKVLPNEEEAG
jgi:hypothetical protein